MTHKKWHIFWHILWHHFCNYIFDIIFVITFLTSFLDSNFSHFFCQFLSKTVSKNMLFLLRCLPNILQKLFYMFSLTINIYTYISISGSVWMCPNAKSMHTLKAGTDIFWNPVYICPGTHFGTYFWTSKFGLTFWTHFWTSNFDNFLDSILTSNLTSIFDSFSCLKIVNILDIVLETNSFWNVTS